MHSRTEVDPLDQAELLGVGLLAALPRLSSPHLDLWSTLQILARGPSAAVFIAASSFLMSSGDELRPIDLDRQLVELAGEGEGRLVVGIVHAGQRVGADIEALVPLQDHRQRLVHLLGSDHLAVDLQRAGAGAADAAEVVEGERAGAHAVILEVELDRVACRASARPVPSHLMRSRSTRFHRKTGLPFSR